MEVLGFEHVWALHLHYLDRLPVQGGKQGWGGINEGMGEANGNEETKDSLKCCGFVCACE